MTKKMLEPGQEKIQKICDLLRQETLEPAKKEAENIIARAQEQARNIIEEANQKAEEILQEARRSIEQERNVFQSSLVQAGKQSIEALRQTIEKRLFNPEVHQLVQKQMSDPKIIADLIRAMIKAIEKEGITGDISAIIPNTISAKDVSQLLGEEILKKLNNNALVVGDFGGGAKVRIEGKQLTFDMSEKELEELLRTYVRKDFRKFLFGN